MSESELEPRGGTIAEQRRAYLAGRRRSSTDEGSDRIEPGQRSSPLDAALDRLHALIKAVEDLHAALTERLTPVVDQERAASKYGGDDDSGPDAPGSSPVVRVLDAGSTRLNGLAERQRELLNALEL